MTNEIDIGCAGGIDVTASAEFDEEETPDGSVGYKITVKGRWSLWNGYSQRTWNANKIMNRLLFDGFDNFGLQIASIHGGGAYAMRFRESVLRK
jgi:dipeptidase D